MRTLYAILLVPVIAGFVASPALAGGDNLFAKIDGKYRGSGTSTAGANGKRVRVSCQLTNSYRKTPGSKSSGAMKMSGRCASSSGAIIIKGAVSHKGDAVSGTYISLGPDTKVLKSSGRLRKKFFSISSSIVNKKTGTQTRIRQVIQLTSAGFQADFFIFDNKTKKFKSAGTISFKRK